ncbi:MAG TPA: hypothetical protein VIJ72_03450 [Rhizomicrobium sp.]
MSLFWDLWHQIHAIVASWDIITMVIALVIIVAAGFAIQSFVALINATLLALVAFGAAGFVRTLLAGGKESASALITDTWHHFLALSMLTALAYAIGFALLIAIVHAVRKLVTGG